MPEFALTSPLSLCLLVVLVGAASSLLPVSPAEPWLLGIAAVAPPAMLPVLILLVTASTMCGKTFVFLGGRRVEASFSGKTRARFETLRLKVAGRPGLQRSTLFLSSVVGLPPFYLITALCGTLRMPLRHFVVLGATGRGIRFAALMLAPQVFRTPEVEAQTLPPAVRIAGAGDRTYVLLTGVVGGIAGYRRLESGLIAAGNRVVTIDPYQLAIDSSCVTFDAMARLVDAELGARGITQAVVVGHSHGGGVALRLAANAPHRVASLYLLDVGAMPSNRGAVFSSAIRLVPLIARLPAGRSFIRNRMVAELRDNSAATGWLDESTERAYTEPLLDNVDRVVKMALRLARADEPEPLAAVVARVRAPTVVLLGETRTKAGPADSEFTALAVLGGLLRIDTVRNAGHFPHEEAPAEVTRRLIRQGHMVAMTDRPELP